jgi:hypothetical protein
MTKRGIRLGKGTVVTLKEETASKPDGNNSIRWETPDPKPQIFDQIIIGEKDVGTYKNTILKTLSIRKSTGAMGVTNVITHRKYIEKAILAVGLAQMEFSDKLIISMSVARETSKLGRDMLKIIFSLLPEVNQ